MVTYSETQEIDDNDNNNTNVIDDAENDSFIAPIQYDISSYGADYDVEGLVKRLKRDDILIPSFQRNYIWNQKEASRFIESLLLGLPIPSIFLAKERLSNKLLVIDGQQRLKTLQFFFDGYFNPKEGDRTNRIFSLIDVQAKFIDLTYQTLNEQDKVKLNDSIIHSIVVKQESPIDDDTSIYYLFDRLNSPGRPLSPQEIRTAIAHGPFIDLIKELNEYPKWRQIYQRRNLRMKDQELILRFLALYYGWQTYKRPMSEFLNRFALNRQNSQTDLLLKYTTLFTSTIDIAWESLGKKAFRPERGINTAVFDSVMVGLATRLSKDIISNFNDVRTSYDNLLNNKEYLTAISDSTSNVDSVEKRMTKAIEAFENI